jgi:hypothetical protein|nr:MAG TPA: hypothetical protein [Caudoviricetes sp.]
MDKFVYESTCYFKIIPFDDALWKLAFKELRYELQIKQINFVPTATRLANFDTYYDVYVDWALIDEHGIEKVTEMVKEKLDEKMRKEFESMFKYSICEMERL